MTISPGPFIRLRGVRHNNLKNFDLDLPLGKLIVVTGLSGSGKSSLAFDTLFAEGQRRYIETFSPYARQFFDRMDKPRVDRIDGIPPAIAIEQRNSVKTTRSTVGTMTEICEYMKVLWAHLGQLYCRGCAEPVHEESPAVIWERLCPRGAASSLDAMVTFALPLSNKMPLAETLDLIAKQGYQRLIVDGDAIRLEEALPRLTREVPPHLTVLQDRLKLTPANRARFAEACEHAYHFGKGKLTVHRLDNQTTRLFSRGLHCPTCDLDYRPPTPALFSFNHPVGACSSCRGFGRVISIDYDRAIPDRTKTLAAGAVKPWQTGHGQESQRDLLKFCSRSKIKTDIPFRDLPVKHQQWVIEGDADYGKDAKHEWPHSWYGVKGYFRWLESKAYKMHVRVLLSRYRAYSKCPECQGRRFTADALLFQVDRVGGARLTLSDFYQLSVAEALSVVQSLASHQARGVADPVALALNEVGSRLQYLVDVGLGYLTLDRPTRSLSGGETERVNLTTCLGSRLVNTLYVLDEPSVGLHPRDTARLVHVLHNLRDIGNTVVVVEHEASVMRSADQIVDLGPGHGESGGHLVFQGTYDEICSSAQSLTGQYLGGSRQIPLRPHRPVGPKAGAPFLTVDGANRNNLKNVSVRIPLGRFVCLTGVSGSGKTTLAREVILPALEECLGAIAATPAESSADTEKASDADEISNPVNARLQGFEQLRSVVLIDQSSLGKTPRSNPAVYIGAFDDIRDLFASSETARQRGLNSSAFSFNSGQGQCERCRGAGFEKIEMQFLSDVFVRCAECQGRRYRPHILEIKLAGSVPGTSTNGANGSKEASVHWSIADLLEASVDEAIPFLLSYFHLSAGRRALQSLKLLQEVGLGYLRLGQPVNTLSGGESQRLKLVKHLAEFTHSQQHEAKPTLLIFDEPTTGLHFEDVRVLLEVFHRLVDAGHSLLIIEHNLDVIRSADWIIDLGPEAGQDGGKVVVAGTPETVAACAASHTGQALAMVRSS